MGKSVEVKVKCLKKDISNVINYIMIRSNRLWVALPVYAFVCLLTALFGMEDGFDNYIYGLLAAYSLALFFTFAYYCWIPINKYTDYYAKRDETTYIFTEESIEMFGKAVRSVCKWSIFKKAFACPNTIILIDSNRFVLIFPKRCFYSTEDIKDFEEIH